MPGKVRRIDNIIYGPKIDTPIDERGLGRTIFDNMQKYKNRILQIDAQSGRRETYEEVTQKCIRVALHIKNRGIKPNDIILVCSENSMEALVPIFSTLYLNNIIVTLDPSMSLRDSIHLMQKVSPKLIFVVEDAIDLIGNAVEQLRFKPGIIVMGSHKKYSTLSDFLKPHANEKTFVPDSVTNIDNTAVIFFSSGCTGLPKGICCSHSSILKSGYRISTDITDASTFLFYMSFYWRTTFIYAIATVLEGSKRLVATRFTPQSFLEYVRKYSVTYSILPASYAMQFNKENTKGYKKESLAEIRVTCNAMPPERLQQLCQYLGDTSVYTLYSLTEAGTVSTFCQASRSMAMKKLSSCGIPYINVELKITDMQTGKKVKPNQTGEICIRSTTLFSRYYNEELDHSLFDDDGFFRTGDIGRYDEDNCIYITDRWKEMFKYQHWHIVPASVEEVIHEHPAVQETIVIGIPNPDDGHHPFALVTLKDGYKVTEDELLAFINPRLIDRERLRAGLIIVKNLPTTCTGLIHRQTVKQMVLAGNISELNK